MHTVRTGSGRPLVLVPGIADMSGWRFVLDGLAAEREVVALDLPGFGETPPLDGEVTFARYADELESHLRTEGIDQADLVGSSFGARLVLEMARRGLGRSIVALDPGGFWTPRQKQAFGATLTASVALVRRVRPTLPTVLGTSAGRTALLAQLSARPWAVPADFATAQLQGLADSPGARPAIKALSTGPDQEGAPSGTLPGPVLIVWGKQDRVTLVSQASRAQALFPDARLELFDACGHFPHWDQPARTVTTVLAATA
ncbi:alpha/beta fold hydrolase [soil metagenome]